MSMLGGPSNVPSLISISPEPSSQLKSDEPHRGQKRSPPARLRQHASSPEKVTLALAQIPKKEKAEPESFRQVSQWQTPTRMGSPSTS